MIPASRSPHLFAYPAARAGGWLLGLLMLALGGCAMQPPAPMDASRALWQAHRSDLERLTDWQVQGRVAIRNADDGWHAEFDWRRQGDSYRLRLRGPFGQGAVELRGDGQGVWLQRQDRPAVFARSVDRLLEQETGWQLPVSGLQAWLVGLPVAEQPAQLAWDDRGLLQSLQQEGWQIDYRQYQMVDGKYLPDRLQLERDALRVKVVVDQWQLL